MTSDRSATASQGAAQGRRDASLRGRVDDRGVKLRIGDQLVDGSVATKLRTLKDQIARDGGASLRAHFDRILGD